MRIKTATGQLPRMLAVLVGTAFAVSVAVFAYGQWQYHKRFGHFASYGLQTDLWRHTDRDSDHAVIDTSYCLAVTNVTLFPVQFEVVTFPGGFVGSGVLARNRVDRWGTETNSWQPIFESPGPTDPPWMSHADAVHTVWPGQTFLPASCPSLDTFTAVKRGDVVREVAYKCYTKEEGRRGQRLFYSPPHTIGEDGARTK